MSRTPKVRAQRKSPEVRTAEIFDAARSLACEQGLAAVTSRALARQVGVAPGLISHYCPSMEVLIADVFTAIVGDELQEVRATVHAAAATAPGRLRTLLHAALDAERMDVTVIWVEAWALGRGNEPLAESVRTQMDGWQELVREVVEEGAVAGDFTVENAGAVAWQLLGIIDGLNAQALVRWEGGSSRATVVGHAVEAMVGLPSGTLDF